MREGFACNCNKIYCLKMINVVSLDDFYEVEVKRRGGKIRLNMNQYISHTHTHARAHKHIANRS